MPLARGTRFGPFEIWVASASDGAGRRPVSKGAHRPAGSPRWSPDGRRLAFDGLGDDGQVHIYLVDEAGGPMQSFTAQTGFSDHLPSWSRDGKSIYFSSNRSGRFEVWRAPVDGGNARQITTGGGWGPMESWDGKTLYFSRATPAGRVIFTMLVEGGAEQQVATTTFWNYQPAERGLYYASQAEGTKAPYAYEVRVLDFETGTHRVLHRLRLAGLAPGLSVLPDGKTVLVSGVSAVSNDLMRIENFR